MEKSVDIAVHTQPIAGQISYLEWLTGVLGDPRFKDIVVVSAWIRESAVIRLRRPIEAFQQRGGRVRVVTGLSGRFATEQALQALLALCDETYVVFDVDGRTFHPKYVLAKGRNSYAMFVGSQNMTVGGLLTNFEVGVSLSWTAVSVTPAPFEKLIEYSRSVISDPRICKRLDIALITLLMNDPRIGLRDEATSPESRSVADGTSEFESTGDTYRFAAPIANHGGRAASVLRSQLPAARAEIRWSKILPEADSQRLATANPSGQIALTKAGYDIDPATYFREILFEGCNWHRVSYGRSIRERALVRFEVIGLPGVSQVLDLEVDYNPSWRSEQRNRSTTLRWGSLNHLIRNEVDVTGMRMTISRMVDLAHGRLAYFRLHFETV